MRSASLALPERKPRAARARTWDANSANFHRRHDCLVEMLPEVRRMLLSWWLLGFGCFRFSSGTRNCIQALCLSDLIFLSVRVGRETCAWISKRSRSEHMYTRKRALLSKVPFSFFSFFHLWHRHAVISRPSCDSLSYAPAFIVFFAFLFVA